MWTGWPASEWTHGMLFSNLVDLYINGTYYEGGPVELGGLQPYIYCGAILWTLSWVDQAARVQVDQWTGWPVTKVAGGPVELGGLQPHRCYDLLLNNLVDMHGQAVRVQVIWWTRWTCYQTNKNYMIEHVYCMLILRV